MNQQMIYVMQGLPASGKSTEAGKMWEPGRTIRVNRDLLRQMLNFGNYNIMLEEGIVAAEIMLIEHFLTQGYDVIIDDTNLSNTSLAQWSRLADKYKATARIIRIDTPIAECIERDAKRETPVGAARIKEMAEKWEDEKRAP